MLQHVFNLDQMHICVVGPSPRLHTSSCTGLLGAVADQGSGWHWGWAVGEPASLLG